VSGYEGVWREPSEESVDLYPGLVVHDGRVSGSITTGRSRLPLWAFMFVAIRDGWGGTSERERRKLRREDPPKASEKPGVAA
jgi:hypothetical protein